MAVEVKWDPVDACRASVTYQGWEIERRAKVTGLSETPDICLLAADELGVAIGDAHPNRATCYLEEIQPSLVSDTQDCVEVSLIYRELCPDPVIDIGTSVSETTTCFDKNGALVTVTYNSKTQKKSFQKLVAESAIRYQRVELLSPGPKSLDYVGTVNSASWTGHAAASARTWLCAAINGSWRAGKYLVTYEFLYRSDTWDQLVFYLDPKTGSIPGDATNDGNAIKRVQLYTETNFDGLGLVFPA